MEFNRWLEQLKHDVKQRTCQWHPWPQQRQELQNINQRKQKNILEEKNGSDPVHLKHSKCLREAKKYGVLKIMMPL